MFEWDEEKRALDIENHGVDFVRAAMIFLNPTFEYTDTREDYGETRYRALGHVEGEFYSVIYTWRGKARRIISAWKAEKNDQRKYHAAFSGRA